MFALSGWWWGLGLAGGAAALVLIVAVIRGPLRRRRQRAHFVQARAEFRRQRERLEAAFFQRAAHSGKPRGLIWKNCDFGDEVVYARQRTTDAIWAIAPVTISFEAVVGGPMEEVEAVGNLRAASALFAHAGEGWATQGRVMFNLEPREALAYYEDELIALDGEGDV